MTLARLCEHGELKEHIADVVPGIREGCPGGSLLPPDSVVIVKEEGEWPKWVHDCVRGVTAYHPLMMRTLDALAVAQPGRE